MITQPTFSVNETISRSNIQMMCEKAAANQLIFRPHFKTHQSVKTGEWFREAGVTAITVSSVNMARKFAAAGWTDITIAFPMNIREAEQVSQLAEQVKLNLLFDTHEQASALASVLKQEAGYFIKIDVGHRRAGILPDDTDSIDRIISAVGSELLKFKGFLTHAGQTYSAKNKDEILSINRKTSEILNGLKQKYINKFPGIITSSGDTPSCSLAIDFTGIDEIRPGNFVYYDLMQLLLGSCSFNQIAAAVICPVVSVYPSRNEALIYGGAVHLSKESLHRPDGSRIFGLAVPFIDGKLADADAWLAPEGDDFVVSLSQEHGIISLDSQWSKNLKPGNLVAIIPVHSCLAADLLGSGDF
ncbi:MAG: alanine racemase [Bacteroidetes bacterium HGW-Bacteroidetes-11]|jgi:D-serine deaminase-like pyridoxal phosphate-dependent protein|nr:MAG: alanine racemase [Bacteroidetes bacterium HGW-Bacteroidetes-11]